MHENVNRLTWVFFQQLKLVHERIFGDKPGGEASFIWGAVAAAASVTVMIPMDTVKTRLVIQVHSLSFLSHCDYVLCVCM